MFKNVLNKVPASDFEQVLYMTANFTQDNPNDGLPFMAMADTAMNKVNSVERTDKSPLRYGMLLHGLLMKISGSLLWK